MARTFPVPLYATAAVGLSNDQRPLTPSQPSAESTATQVAMQSLGGNSYLRPEQSGSSGAVLPAGQGQGWGWLLDPLPTLVPTVADGYTVEAGTWQVIVHHSRPGGLVTGNISNVTVTAVIQRVSADGATVRQEIGRQGQTIGTITTTKQSLTINVLGALATFAAGERIALEVHVAAGPQLLGDQSRWHTNAGAALRITQIPEYTIQYARPLADVAPVAETLTRQYTGSRTLVDNAAVAELLTRAYTARRALADAVPPVADTVARTYRARRALADAAPVADAIARQFTGARRLADDAPVADAITRRVTYRRALDDRLAEGGGQVVVRRPIILLGE